MRSTTTIILVLILVIAGIIVFKNSRQFALPDGETIKLTEGEGSQNHSEEIIKPTKTRPNTQTTSSNTNNTDNSKVTEPTTLSSTRELLVTDGVNHSIPLNEILSGGPGKDGIPSIDDPKFTSVQSAKEFLNDTDVGLGFIWKGEARFYPYQILVWHEIVNDTIAGDRVLVTYCPLCATGVVFDPTVNGIEREFGVSGKLWQSNLLMYDRTGDGDTESLWSQVLGEGVLGPETGTRLKVLRADTVQFGSWIKDHPDTTVLSVDTGESRRYGSDPYGDYYTNESVSFGATFNDDRLHPKRFVLGIEIDGKFKAYDKDALPIGETTDTFNGNTITIQKTSSGEVLMTTGKGEVSFIGGFWFSWLAVHPDTELWKN
ncbi:hypothetical protein COB55_01060 [Candidatus Wolfebacteria bacterium]|nr:MAG: hypothetical protein COB55_01060 [Candidatus Wolfebacteria bacterium]